MVENNVDPFHVAMDARTRMITTWPRNAADPQMVFCVDLVGDLWRDYLAFLDEARERRDARDPVGRSRCLRAAITCLFSHTDGIVREIYHKAWGVSPQARNDVCLKKMMIEIREAGRQRGCDLEYVDIEMKVIRDILNHPRATRDIWERGQLVAEYSSITFYSVTVGDVEGAGLWIDRWLAAGCKAFGVVRFHDTERLLKELHAAYDAEVGRPIQGHDVTEI